MADETEGGTPTGPQLDQIIEKLDTVIAKQKESLRLRQEDAESLSDYNDQLRIQVELEEKELTLQSQQLAAQQKAAQKKLIEAQKNKVTSIEIIQALEEELNAVEALIVANAKQRAQQELIRNTINQTERSVGGIAGKLGIATKFSQTAVGQFADMALNLKQSGRGGEILFNALATTLSPANLLASLFEKIYESVIATAIAVDKAESALQRSTGFAINFRDSMLDVAEANVMSGVTIDDTQKSFGALISNFSAFRPTAEAANESLLKTTTLLEKVGVTADVSTKQIDFLTRAMGMSAEEAQAMTVEIALAADRIGISASKMTSDFAAVSKNLSVYGDQMVDVFMDLEAQAKATGVEVSRLVEIGAQFNTFDKAAEITGKLNSVLGTNLSSLQMINLTEAERVKLLRQELRATVGNFDSLDKYTQMYIQQAAGLSSVEEARRLVNASEAEYLSYNKQMQERAATQQQLKEATESFVPIVDALKIAVLNLALEFKPLISGFTSMIEGAIFLSKYLKDAIIVLGSWMLATKIATGIQFLYVGALLSGAQGFVGLTLAMVKALGQFLYYNLYIPISTFVTNLFAASQRALGVSLIFSMGKLLLFAGILYLVYKAITRRGSPPLYMIGFTMALAIIALGVAVKIGGNKLLIFAGILAVIFFAIHLVIESIAGLVSVVSEMFQMFIDNVSILPQLALGLYLVGGAFLFFAASVASGATMLAMAAPFLLMAAVAMAPLVAEVVLLGRAFQMIGSGMEQIVAGLEAISAFKSDDEFFAIQASGETTTMVSAKGGILKNFSSDKLSVEVKIPEINMPTPVVKVYIGDQELRSLIRTEMSKA